MSIEKGRALMQRPARVALFLGNQWADQSCSAAFFFGLAPSFLTWAGSPFAS